MVLSNKNECVKRSTEGQLKCLHYRKIKNNIQCLPLMFNVSAVVSYPYLYKNVQSLSE